MLAHALPCSSRTSGSSETITRIDTALTLRWCMLCCTVAHTWLHGTTAQIAYHIHLQCRTCAAAQFAHKWLAGRGAIGADPGQFKAALTQMWFSLYRREVQNDSSGFEHVFLGESDNGEVKVGCWPPPHLRHPPHTAAPPPPFPPNAPDASRHLLLAQAKPRRCSHCLL